MFARIFVLLLAIFSFPGCVGFQSHALDSGLESAGDWVGDSWVAATGASIEVANRLEQRFVENGYGARSEERLKALTNPLLVIGSEQHVTLVKAQITDDLTFFSVLNAKLGKLMADEQQKYDEAAAEQPPAQDDMTSAAEQLVLLGEKQKQLSLLVRASAKRWLTIAWADKTWRPILPVGREYTNPEQVFGAVTLAAQRTDDSSSPSAAAIPAQP